MRICLLCRTPAEASDVTCARCGEATWGETNEPALESKPVEKDPAPPSEKSGARDPGGRKRR